MFKENYQDQIIMHMIIVNNDEYENNFLLNNVNKNEVQLVSKNVKNKGFFEKFFQLFS